jgi:uncharacterized protein
VAASNVVVDTGPIVAWLDADAPNHAWARAQFARLRPPLLTCEAVLTEAGFLLARAGAGFAAVSALVERGVLTIAPLFDAEAAAITALMRRYKNVPMSLTDACLVRLIEQTPNATLMTLDSDFRVYRQKGRRLIALLTPEDRA